MISGRFWEFSLNRNGFSMARYILPSGFPKPLLLRLGIKKAPYCCDDFPQYTRNEDFAVYIRTGGAGQVAFHGMDGFVHDWVRVSFPVHTYIAICPNSQIYGD